MTMTGKATIILADAKTGEELYRTEEHNLVTNALTNIFNPPHAALLHSFDYSKLFSDGLPMWKNLLGGVMLLGNSEAESADNILLSKNIVPVATAGDAYSGSSVTRGSLNLNESYSTENGYRFTWDFGTDKANGSISCICLTSRMFGNSGFCNDEAGFMYAAPNSMTVSNAVSYMYLDKGYGQYIGSFDGLHWFARLTSDKMSVEIRRYAGLDPTHLRINDVSGLSNASQAVSVDVVQLPIEAYSDEKLFVNATERRLYYFARSYTSTADTTTVSYSEINLDTLEATGHTVTLGKKINYYQHGAVHDGKLYFFTSNQLHIFSSDGGFIETVEAELSTSSLFFETDGMLMLRNSGSYPDICIDWGMMKLRHGVAGYPTGSEFPRPYVSSCTRTAENGNTKPHLLFATWYKATINNLSAPIEKTSAHTLKIVYDITN